MFKKAMTGFVAIVLMAGVGVATNASIKQQNLTSHNKTTIQTADIMWPVGVTSNSVQTADIMWPVGVTSKSVQTADIMWPVGVTSKSVQTADIMWPVGVTAGSTAVA